MNFPVSENVARMQSSSTFKAMQAAANLREQGFDVIDLTVGEPDFPTPEFIKDLAIEGLHKGYTKYTPPAGLKSFNEAVALFYSEQFGANISAERNCRVVRRKTSVIQCRLRAFKLGRRLF